MSATGMRGLAMLTPRRWAVLVSVGVLAVTAACFASAASSAGEPLKHRDAAHDMQKRVLVTDPATDQTVRKDRAAAPGHADGDITGYQLTYRDGQVTASVSFRSLSPGTKSHSVGTTTSSYRKLQLMVLGSNGKQMLVGATRNSAGAVIVSAGNGTLKQCTGATGSYASETTTITVTAPAKCLGSPQKVRASIESVDEKIVQSDSSIAVVDYVDSAIGRYSLLGGRMTDWVSEQK